MKRTGREQGILPLEIDLPSSLKELKIVTLADFHIGDPLCDINRVKEIIKEIKDTPNLYAIINGDILNNATKNSVSNSYGEVLSPRQQMLYAVELFEPIKDKILGVISGNHEYRTDKETDSNLLWDFAYHLDLIDRYTTDGILFFIRFGELNKKKTNGKGKRKVCYTIYATHGSRAGKANTAVPLKNIVFSDIYITSHKHRPQQEWGLYFLPDTRNNTVQEIEQLFIVTGATMKYGGYALRKIYEPAPSTRNSIIILSGDKKFINAYQ